MAEPTFSFPLPQPMYSDYPVEVQAAADKVRDLKAAKASKEEIVAAVQVLKELKEKHGIVEVKEEKKKAPIEIKTEDNAAKEPSAKEVNNNIWYSFVFFILSSFF